MLRNRCNSRPVSAWLLVPAAALVGVVTPALAQNNDVGLPGNATGEFRRVSGNVIEIVTVGPDGEAVAERIPMRRDTRALIGRIELRPNQLRPGWQVDVEYTARARIDSGDDIQLRKTADRVVVITDTLGAVVRSTRRGSVKLEYEVDGELVTRSGKLLAKAELIGVDQLEDLPPGTSVTVDVVRGSRELLISRLERFVPSTQPADLEP